MILDQYYTKGLSKQKSSLIALELGTHWVKLSWIPKSCKTKESRVYCFGVYLCGWQKQPDLASLKCQLCSAEERVGESLSRDESLPFSSCRDYMLLWTFHSPFHPLPQDRELCVADDLSPGSGGLETFVFGCHCGSSWLSQRQEALKWPVLLTVRTKHAQWPLRKHFSGKPPATDKQNAGTTTVCACVWKGEPTASFLTLNFKTYMLVSLSSNNDTLA